MTLLCTRLVESARGWHRCDKPAKWMVRQLGKDVPRCGNHAKHAKDRMAVKL